MAFVFSVLAFLSGIWLWKSKKNMTEKDAHAITDIISFVALVGVLLLICPILLPVICILAFFAVVGWLTKSKH
jgi:hypothetical protein